MLLELLTPSPALVCLLLLTIVNFPGTATGVLVGVTFSSRRAAPLARFILVNFVLGSRLFVELALELELPFPTPFRPERILDVLLVLSLLAGLCAGVRVVIEVAALVRGAGVVVESSSDSPVFDSNASTLLRLLRCSSLTLGVGGMLALCMSGGGVILANPEVEPTPLELLLAPRLRDAGRRRPLPREEDERLMLSHALTSSSAI